LSKLIPQLLQCCVKDVNNANVGKLVLIAVHCVHMIAIYSYFYIHSDSYSKCCCILPITSHMSASYVQMYLWIFDVL